MTGVPFLLTPPDAETSAMGEATVGTHTDDPLSPVINPAHLGMIIQKNFFSFGYDDFRQTFGVNVPDVRLRTFALNAGINLKKLDRDGLPLSFGAGYSRIHLSLGTFAVTRNDPAAPETFEPFESSDQFTVAVAVDCWVRGSVGVTYKHVLSHLSPFGAVDDGGDADGKANLYDYGMLVDVPVLDIASRLSNAQLQLLPRVSPFLDVSVGFSRNNLGQESISYIDPAQGDPLPRIARAGIGIDLGLQYLKNGAEWRPLSFKWTTEASSLLANPYPERGYRSGFGDIKFFDDIVLGKADNKVQKGKGWELNLLEFLFIRGGRVEIERLYLNPELRTAGWGLRLAGLTRFLQIADVPLSTSGILGFIFDHLDVRYNHSTRSINSVNIMVSN